MGLWQASESTPKMPGSILAAATTIPENGRWTTPDPIGFADGPNLYAYLRHNPIYLDVIPTASSAKLCVIFVNRNSAGLTFLIDPIMIMDLRSPLVLIFSRFYELPKRVAKISV